MVALHVTGPQGTREDSQGLVEAVSMAMHHITTYDTCDVHMAKAEGGQPSQPPPTQPHLTQGLQWACLGLRTRGDGPTSLAEARLGSMEPTL